MARGITQFAVLSAAVFASPMAASASFSQIQFDINGLRADAGGPFGGFTHTGTINLVNDANTVLNAIIVDAVSFPTTATLTGITGFINLNVGSVIGGQFTVSLSDGSQYMASLNAGFVSPQAGQGFQINGLSFSGVFNGTSFGGVDVTGVGNVDGSFVLSTYGPDASGVDAETDIDIFAAPAPGAAIALLGAGGLAFGRRRRR